MGQAAPDLGAGARRAGDDPAPLADRLAARLQRLDKAEDGILGAVFGVGSAPEDVVDLGLERADEGVFSGAPIGDAARVGDC